MFFVFNTFIVIEINNGTIMNITIGNPILTFVSVCLCNLFSVFILFVLVFYYAANIKKHITIGRLFNKTLTFN